MNSAKRPMLRCFWGPGRRRAKIIGHDLLGPAFERSTPMPVTIRPAVPDDYPAICKLFPNEEELFLAYPKGEHPNRRPGRRTDGTEDGTHGAAGGRGSGWVRQLLPASEGQVRLHRERRDRSIAPRPRPRKEDRRSPSDAGVPRIRSADGSNQRAQPKRLSAAALRKPGLQALRVGSKEGLQRRTRGSTPFEFDARQSAFGAFGSIQLRRGL